MLHEGILHKCIKQLLEKKKNVHPKDLAEDLECLCQIMKTVGRRLDTNKAKVSLLYINIPSEIEKIARYILWSFADS